MPSVLLSVPRLRSRCAGVGLLMPLWLDIQPLILAELAMPP